MREKLEEVFARELKRLDEKSQVGPLSLDDLKALSLLTQSLKSYQEPPKQPENPFKDLSTAQLLELLENTNERDTSQPSSQAKGPKRNRKARSE